MTSMEYSPNGNSIMTLMEYTPMVYSPSEKSMILSKIVFRSGNCHGKRLKKIQYKRCMHYSEVDKKMLPVVFEKFERTWTIFSLSLSTSERSTLAKLWGAAAPPISMDLIFKGSCLKQKNTTFTLPNIINFIIVYELDTCSRDLNSDSTYLEMLS